MLLLEMPGLIPVLGRAHKPRMHQGQTLLVK
jgi:hypothetical protein